MAIFLLKCMDREHQWAAVLRVGQDDELLKYRLQQEWPPFHIVFDGFKVLVKWDLQGATCKEDENKYHILMHTYGTWKELVLICFIYKAGKVMPGKERWSWLLFVWLRYVSSLQPMDYSTPGLLPSIFTISTGFAPALVSESVMLSQPSLPLSHSSFAVFMGILRKRRMGCIMRLGWTCSLTPVIIYVWNDS